MDIQDQQDKGHAVPTCKTVRNPLPLLAVRGGLYDYPFSDSALR
jgi:hypothetical protein